MFDIDTFVSLIKSLSGENLFNPYNDICQVHDKDSAASKRENNLRKYLQAVNHCNSIIIGEAPGHLGCRKSGIPFVDIRHLNIVAEIYNIINLEIPTITLDTKEKSALYVWQSVSTLDRPPFIWNIIPLHPYKKGNQFTNRTPNKSDIQRSIPVIKFLLKKGNFTKIFAIGRIAEKTLRQLGYSCTYIRHPSYGGSKIFAKQIQELL